jgi:hypothetical protein
VNEEGSGGGGDGSTTLSDGWMGGKKKESPRGRGICEIWNFVGPCRVVPLRGLRVRGEGLDSLLGGNRGGLGLGLGKEKMTGTEFVISLLPLQKPQRARATSRTAQNVHGAGVDQVLQIYPVIHTYPTSMPGRGRDQSKS